MTAKSTKTAFSMELYKAVLEEATSSNKPYLETGHLHPEKDFLQNFKSYKGLRDRDSIGDVAA